MADFDHDNNDREIFYDGHEPVVAYTVFPEISEPRAFQSFAYASGIFKAGEALV
jgi:hypothetical protein